MSKLIVRNFLQYLSDGDKYDTAPFIEQFKNDIGGRTIVSSVCVQLHIFCRPLSKNVFCNPAFELEGELEEREGFRMTTSTPEPIKPPTTGSVAICQCPTLRASPRLKHVGHTNICSLTSPHYYKGCYFSGYGTDSLRILSGCGGVLTDSEGFFSSPNHPGSYPPNTLCVWVIQATPPHFIQIHVSSLNIEGPAPCLFDWLENSHMLREGCLCPSFRFCGAVAPPTVNTNSSTVWVTFRSDGSIAGNGFSAQYRALLPGHKSCSRDEFMCDGGRCLLPASVCDGHPNCHDQKDEANCSNKHSECGGQKIGPYGFLASPNHPSPYPHQQLCVWHIAVEEGHVVMLRFKNFSLEAQDVCEFDYVEVHDGSDAGAGRVLGRFCGTTLPPDLTSSGQHMTVLFVADEGVADSGFNATYQSVSLLDREFFLSKSYFCLHPQWLCDGWNDCPDGADEQDSIFSMPPASPCESIDVEMCLGLSYNLTSFPNIWLAIADQREAATLLRQYRVLMELACFEPLRKLICGMFLPQCSPHGGVLQPCRSVCLSAEQQCSQALDLFSFSWPFNCHLLPDTQDPMECSLP
uniref:Membrane frizzled-related protein n=1 Tax=Hippocampus comes TaxID=109280 RepID=A0A3Q2Y1K9_HIPCM